MHENSRKPFGGMGTGYGKRHIRAVTGVMTVIPSHRRSSTWSAGILATNMSVTAQSHRDTSPLTGVPVTAIFSSVTIDVANRIRAGQRIAGRDEHAQRLAHGLKLYRWATTIEAWARGVASLLGTPPTRQHLRKVVGAAGIGTHREQHRRSLVDRDANVDRKFQWDKLPLPGQGNRCRQSRRCRMPRPSRYTVDKSH